MRLRDALVQLVAAAGSVLLATAMSAAPMDPVALAQALVRATSVTPADGGAMDVVAGAAARAGFAVHIFDACDGARRVRNLVATRGRGRPRLAFVGHVDVVPAGDPAAWRHPPFAATLAGGALHGRGAVDMKGAIAAFLVAAERVQGPALAPLQLLVTGDEEEGSPEGMRAIIAYLRAHDAVPAACLVGEPSNEGAMGQGIRVGRRGSLNVRVTARGVQGHVAWPHRADNAAHHLVRFLVALQAHDFGPADAVFPATQMQVTGLSVPHAASNVVPAVAQARVNVRFNRRYDGAALQAELDALAAAVGPQIALTHALSGEPYLASAPALVAALAAAAQRASNRTPAQNAGGGVSDGRFLHTLCPVVEYGLIGDTAHQVDEQVALADLAQLTDTYADLLAAYLAG